MEQKVNRMQKLVEILNNASSLYYNGNKESPLSDEEFDTLLEELNQLEKETGIVLENSPVNHVGSETTGKKVKHNHPMLSLAKCHTAQELLSFAGNNQCYLSVKCDGLTCSLRYLNGELISAETRGNGEIGTDILFHVKNFSNVPQRISYTGELIVDGEAVIFYSDFDRINNALPEESNFKNARNLAAGTLNALDENLSRERNLQFVAWRVIQGLDGESNFFMLKELEKLGFSLPPMYSFSSSQDKENIESMLHELRLKANNIGLPMDGVVLAIDDVQTANSMGKTEHHFNHSIAYKFDDETYPSKLLDIEWTVGRTGVLTPTAVFETVLIDGTEVSRASLHNPAVMNKLTDNRPWYKGMVVNVYKANQIIPQIKSVEYSESLAEELLLPPKFCPVCGSPLAMTGTSDSQNLMCFNTMCLAKTLSKFVNFVSKKGMDIEGLSEKTLDFLITNNYLNSFADIYHLFEHKDAIMQVKGFGKKSVEKLLDSIEKSRSVTLQNYLVALGIPNIGPAAAKTISQYFNGDHYDFIQALNTGFDFSQLNDFGDIVNQSLHSWWESKDSLMELLPPELTFVRPETQSSNIDFGGRTFCITGSLSLFANRDALVKDIESKGGKYVSGVSKNTNFLINNDKESNSSKNKKALSLGIPILTEQDYINLK